MHQSIPAVPIPPPPRATVGHLLRCQSRGWGIRNFIAAPGLGISTPRGRPPSIWHTRFRTTDKFIGKDEAFVKDWLVPSGTRKISMFLNVCFINFRYFFITCKHINISDKVNYILFITKQSLTWTAWTQLFCLLHSKLAFMKVELKYWRFMNSNDPIFKTGLASLKYSKPMAFIQENIKWHAIF